MFPMSQHLWLLKSSTGLWLKKFTRGNTLLSLLFGYVWKVPLQLASLAITKQYEVEVKKAYQRGALLSLHSSQAQTFPHGLASLSTTKQYGVVVKEAYQRATLYFPRYLARFGRFFSSQLLQLLQSSMGQKLKKLTRGEHYFPRILARLRMFPMGQHHWLLKSSTGQ